MENNQTVYDHDKLVKNFTDLMKKIQVFFDENKIRTTVSNTKLAKYLNDLNELNINSDNCVQQNADLYYLVVKFLQLEHFLDKKNEKVSVKPEDIRKIICGQCDVNDSDHEYNGPFYELSMASRFVKAFNREVKVDLTTDCDIIIANYIALECKYIFSEKRVSDNIEKAIEQLNNRINNNLAKVGIVAIDLSNLFDRKEVIDFSKKVFDRFAYHHEILNKQGIKYGELPKVSSVIKENQNYIKVVRSYLQNEMEVVFLRSVTNKVMEKMHKDTKVKAIVYQVGFGIGFEYKDEKVATSIRCMSYYINQNLNESEKEEIQTLIKLLEVGL